MMKIRLALFIAMGLVLSASAFAPANYVAIQGMRDVAAFEEAYRGLANTDGLRGIGGIFTCSVDAKGFGKMHKSIIIASDESEAKRVFLNGFPRSSKKFRPTSSSTGEQQFTLFLTTPELTKKGARGAIELNSVDCSLYNTIQ